MEVDGIIEIAEEPLPKMGKSNLRKFLALTWKTLIVKKRHYVETAFDLIIPTILFVLLAVLYYEFMEPTRHPHDLVDSGIAYFIGLLMPMFTVLSFSFVIPPILKRIVQEKQSGVKELMKMMGLPSWITWMFYFFEAIVTLIIIITIITMALCVEWIEDEGKVIKFTDGSILYIFFLLYSMALIVFLFAISTIFSNRKTKIFYS